MSENRVDIGDENLDEPVSGGGLKAAWEGNPLLKMAAVVVALGALYGGYAMLFKTEEEGPKTVIRVGDTKNATQIAGSTEVDPAYQAALEETNRKNAELAAQTGGSALPTPIGTLKSGTLDVDTAPEKPDADPLAEWRKAAEARRMNAEKEAAEQEAEVQPDIVPLVQPVRPQPQVQAQLDQKYVQALAAQMRTIVEGHAPDQQSQALLVTEEMSIYSKAKKEEEEKKAQLAQLATTAGVGADGSSGAGQPNVPIETIVPAGEIAYGQLLNELNSDIQGPVLLHILSGPFAGGRALGQIEVKDEYMVLTFSAVVKDAVSYKVSAVALDEKTTLAGQATDVDHHYFTRIILPAAAKFVEGYASAVAETSSTTTQTAGGGQTTDDSEPDTTEEVNKGVEEAGKKVAEIFDEQADRPITVKIARGTSMGLLFMASVTSDDAGR